MDHSQSGGNILIADSGATKTDWCLTYGGEIVQRFSTKGISPVYQTERRSQKKSGYMPTLS